MKRSITEFLKETLFNFSDKTAYQDEIRKVTFAEVDKFSGKIGCSLVKRNVFCKPILVLMERNALTPTCHIGIARSGNYYIPMDTTNPIIRLQQIIDIVESKILIVDKKSLTILDNLKFDGEILIFEQLLTENFEKELLEPIEQKISSHFPLYIIFTSGSTGKPKGVTTSHEALINYLESVIEILSINDNDILGNQSPMDYIAAVRDIYIPLMTGATTQIIPSKEFSIPNALLDRLNNTQITTICWSAAGLELCVNTGLFECGIPKYIKKILFSGSVLSATALMAWQKALPNAVFVNQYGPTEATASCTYHVVREIANENTVLPIGIPYKNYKIIILDTEGKEIINNEIGEICVSGPSISLGYYNNLEATQKSFIQNPTNKFYREILYKTGDLGRLNNNGEYEYCGRIDRQFKIMGHRIEPEEIEQCGKNIKDVNECVCIYDKSKSLIYFVYSGDAVTRDISLTFRKKLPSYMIPRKIIQIEKIPKLPNGKINIKQIEKEILK